MNCLERNQTSSVRLTKWQRPSGNKLNLEFSLRVQRPVSWDGPWRALRWCLRQTASEATTMGRYRHLSIEEREEIMCLRREGAGVGGHSARHQARQVDGVEGAEAKRVPGRRAQAALPRLHRAAPLRGEEGALPPAEAARRPRAQVPRPAQDPGGPLVARAGRRQGRARGGRATRLGVDHLPGDQRPQARHAEDARDEARVCLITSDLRI